MTYALLCLWPVYKAYRLLVVFLMIAVFGIEHLSRLHIWRLTDPYLPVSYVCGQVTLQASGCRFESDHWLCVGEVSHKVLQTL